MTRRTGTDRKAKKMAISKEVLEENELAKSNLLNSNLDDRCKRSMLRLLNVSLESTNGISIEEKIQKITECVHGLVLSQITFLDSVDKKIESANKEQCKTCKAMKHADEVEEEDKKRKLIEDWKKANGIVDLPDGTVKAPEQAVPETWLDALKITITKPGMWIFLTLLSISPYGVDIVKALLEFFGK